MRYRSRSLRWYKKNVPCVSACRYAATCGQREPRHRHPAAVQPQHVGPVGQTPKCRKTSAWARYQRLPGHGPVLGFGQISLGCGDGWLLFSSPFGGQRGQVTGATVPKLGLGGFLTANCTSDLSQSFLAQHIYLDPMVRVLAAPARLQPSTCDGKMVLPGSCAKAGITAATGKNTRTGRAQFCR